MNYKILFAAGATVLGVIAVWYFFPRADHDRLAVPEAIPSPDPDGRAPDSQEGSEAQDGESAPGHPMAIATLRAGEYPGGDFAIEETLPNGSNYRQYIASYRSEGLKIYGLLTVPQAAAPAGGHPAILFLHGYIPPREYSTTGNYPTYQAALARAGFVTFKPDLRGHGRSEGEATGAHFSEKYVIDTLSALAYLKNHPDVNPERIGYWGHSNGGEIGLRTAVLTDDIRAYSLWAGVVGSFEHHLETYNAQIPFLRDAHEEDLVRENGLPSANRAFWNALEPYAFLENITAPVELRHGTRDASVPVELSRELKNALEEAGKEVVLIEYPGDDHNISANQVRAWEQTIAFFREHL